MNTKPKEGESAKRRAKKKRLNKYEHPISGLSIWGFRRLKL